MKIIEIKKIGTFYIGKGRNYFAVNIQFKTPSLFDRFRMKFCGILTLGWIRWDFDKGEL